jgi:hypothetical protein
LRHLGEFPVGSRDDNAFAFSFIDILSRTC